MFARIQRGQIKDQVQQMAEAITLARTRFSWEETHKTLQDFFGWTGTLRQLVGAYARIRVQNQNKQTKEEAPEKPAPVQESAKTAGATKRSKRVRKNITA
jgi:hypothetical protein